MFKFLIIPLIRNDDSVFIEFGYTANTFWKITVNNKRLLKIFM